MKKFLFSLIFIYSINPIFPTRFLHVHHDESEANKPLVIKSTDSELAELVSRRYKRDLGSDRSESLRNISTKVKIETQTKHLFYVDSYQWNDSICVISINSVRFAALLD